MSTINNSEHDFNNKSESSNSDVIIEVSLRNDDMDHGREPSAPLPSVLNHNNDCAECVECAHILGISHERFVKSLYIFIITIFSFMVIIGFALLLSNNKTHAIVGGALFATGIVTNVIICIFLSRRYRDIRSQ